MLREAIDDAPPPPPPEAVERYCELQAAAAAAWRNWATTIAYGGDRPGTVDLLSAAAVLELARPGEALDGDVAAIDHDRRLHDAIDRHRAGHPRVWPDHPREDFEHGSD